MLGPIGFVLAQNAAPVVPQTGNTYLDAVLTVLGSLGTLAVGIYGVDKVKQWRTPVQTPVAAPPVQVTLSLADLPCAMHAAVIERINKDVEHMTENWRADIRDLTQRIDDALLQRRNDN